MLKNYNTGKGRIVMTENYLQILIECLEKKQVLLDKVKDLNERQAEMLLQEVVDKEAFDKSMDEKQELIDGLNQLDDGFQKTYELVKEEVQKNKEAYLPQLRLLKKQVNHVVDQGVSVQAQEERLKQKVSAMLRKEYAGLHQKRLSARATQGYYQNMQLLNTVDPQLMNRRK